MHSLTRTAVIFHSNVAFNQMSIFISSDVGPSLAEICNIPLFQRLCGSTERQQHLIECVQRTQFTFSQFTVKFIYQLEFKQSSSWGMAIDVQELLQIEKRTLHFQFILSPMIYSTINCHRCSVCNGMQFGCLYLCTSGRVYVSFGHMFSNFSSINIIVDRKRLSQFNMSSMVYLK